MRCGYTVIPHELVVKASDGSEVSIAQLWGRREGSKFNGVSYPVQCAAVFESEHISIAHSFAPSTAKILLGTSFSVMNASYAES